ncbi:MAG: methionine--tRNA ligase [Balneolaceae bacterium]
MSKRILVTSALPYANGPIHLGHLAGAYLPSDFYTRYQRLRGRKILHICGSDEHGVPITIAAEKEGKTPQEIVDRFHERNKSVFRKFGISFDYYGRTSSEVHHKTSQEFFLNLHKKGVFKKKREEQLYDEKAEMFLPDRYVKGTCPVCGYEEAFGDQCEKCGSSLSPAELIDPLSMLSGDKPSLRETEHWYLPLGELQADLEKWLDNKSDWKPNVLGQCKSWLNEGLNDRAVTRDLKWGVPVPLEDAENKVLYVWFDAPIGYISATREWAESQGDPNAWREWWMNEDTDLIHFIGKDNIVFHCIMFPAMLMQHGDYILPKNVPANEFLNLEGRKLSTSRGWAVWLEEALERYEPDLLRYVLGSILPEAKDSDFSWRDFQSRINSELADILGNFIFRTLSFTDRYFDGKVPELVNATEKDKKALYAIKQTKVAAESAYERFRFREAIAETMNLARTGNRYFTEMEPWKSRKENSEKCANTLHVSLQISAALATLFTPVLPGKMKQLRDQLGMGEVAWDNVSDLMLKAGSSVRAGEILFAKIEDDQMEKELERLKGNVEAGQKDYEPQKKPIEYGEFAKLDIRAGRIEEAVAVEKSKKLIQLRVDIGYEKRTILAGVAGHYEPNKLVGMSVCVVANLKPKKMMGIESQGMVLMAEDREGQLCIVSTDAEPGSPIM